MDIELETAFFEDVALAEDDARTVARAGVSGEPDVLGEASADAFRRLAERLQAPDDVDAFVGIVGEIVHMVVHSVMVTLDGGTPSADVESGPVRLVDANGEEARGGLHEWYVDHLFETGRRR